MRNKSAILVLVVVISLVAVAPALAAGPGGGKGQLLHEQRQMGRAPRQPFFALVGVITAIDGGIITVQVQGGNWVVKQYIGEELAIQVTDNTRYRQWTPQGCVPIEFGDVSVEDTASVQGVLLSDGTFVAQRVTVDVPLNCCTP
jgi:hypothetical protein